VGASGTVRRPCHNAGGRWGGRSFEPEALTRGGYAMLRRGLPVLALVLAVGLAVADDEKKDTPKDKDPDKKSGTVIGVLTDKGTNWIEVKAAGEEKARRYVPHWVGGLPKDGGGLDKKIVKQIGELKVGSRVRLEWKFEERLRIEKIEVLQEKDAAKKDD